jgi:hypothetical protein
MAIEPATLVHVAYIYCYSLFTTFFKAFFTAYGSHKLTQGNTFEHMVVDNSRGV